MEIERRDRGCFSCKTIGSLVVGRTFVSMQEIREREMEVEGREVHLGITQYPGVKMGGNLHSGG